MSEIVETTFGVDGMFCGGCAATVERALRRMPGVQEVSVSFLSDTALIRHDGDAVTPALLAQSLARLGYETHAVGGNRDNVQSTFQREHRIRLAIAIGFGMWVMLATIARYFTELPDERFAVGVALAAGLFSLPVFVVSGWPFFRLGWRGLRAGVPGMESLILVATIAAIVASSVNLVQGNSDVWFEVPVMLIVFQLVARLADFGARRRASDAVRAMLDLSPARAWRVDDTDQITSVEVAALVEGDIIESRPGERMAADGQVIAGSALVDRSLLSGESLPVEVTAGDTVLAGTSNQDGTLRIRVSATSGARTLDHLAGLVGRALNTKSDLMRLVDRVAGWLVPLIGAAAVISFTIALFSGATATDALARAVAVLVVSCPCALSLAVPLVVSATVANAASSGIVLRDPASLEHADSIDTVLLDKTGTLTNGCLSVVRVMAEDGWRESDVLALAAFAEAGSNHPLATAIGRYAATRQVVSAESDAGARSAVVAERFEQAGAGVRVLCEDGRRLLAGSARWLAANGIGSLPDPIDPSCSRVLVALDGRAIGALELADTPRTDAAALLASLHQRGIATLLASGDTPGVVEPLATALGIDWRAGLDPDEKRILVESLQAEGRRVAFVGDGLNDGPALAVADLGIATGDASDLARSAAAMSVLQGGLDRIDIALRLARRASSVLKQNLVWAIVYNAVLIPAAVAGYVHPLMAVVAMVASSLSVSTNSLRLVTRIMPRTTTSSH